MICIRQDLIDKELNEICKGSLSFAKLKLSNHFIDWLFNHYYTAEFSEHYYDDEPDIPPEWEDDYTCFDNPDFLKVWNKLVEEYEPKRLAFNNWIDPYSEGIWNMSQHKVDKIAKSALHEVRSTTVKKNGRLYVAHEDDYIYIYWYGRDFMQLDYWRIMKKKKR